MTKKEIVKQIADRAGLTQLKTKEIVQWTFDAIVETLIAEKRIELRNFGVFEVKRRKARKARNPRTDEQVFVGPKNVVTFQPGKEMEQQVREMPLMEEKPRKPRKGRGPDGSLSSSPTIGGPDGMAHAASGAHSVANGIDGAEGAKKKKAKKEG